MPWNPRRAIRPAFGMILVSGLALAADDPPRGTYKEGFETPKVSWRREQTDASVSIQVHERTTRAAHEGRISEHFAFKAGAGSVLYYSLNIPKAAISDSTRASVYVRANRPGLQLFGRVVLPGDIDPETNRPSCLMVPGESLTSADRWERLELADLRAGLAREARTLRLGSNRKVSLEGAYLERLVVNLYGGPGDNEVFLDEVSVSPVADEEPPQVSEDSREEPRDEAKPAQPGASAKDTSRVQLSGGQILRDGAEWFPLIIDAPGADLKILHQFGFDVAVIPQGAPPKVAEEAVAADMLLMPTFEVGPNDDPTAILNSIASYPLRKNVAFWNIGNDLGRSRDPKARKSELDHARKVIMGVHDLPNGQPRLVLGTVADGLPFYALAGRNLDVMGIEISDWGTIRDPLDTYMFLNQRRNLTAVKNARAPFMAWIEASAPPSASKNIWGSVEPPSWGRPQVQPEQIRMHAFTALASGYRALGFRADSEITSASGRPRLLEMALLNAELELIEPILARGSEPIQFLNAFEKDPDTVMVYNTMGAGAGMGSTRSSPLTRPQKEVAPHKSIKTASIPTGDGRGRLLLVSDYAPGGQYQPPQMGLNDLKLVITGAENSQAFEINPAGIRVLNRERVTGGLRFTIPMFSGSSIVLVTTDHSIKGRLEAAVARTAPMASEFAIEQARASIDEVSEVNAQLARAAHPVRDAGDLIQQANDHLKSAIEARDRMDYALAWYEARWVGRSMRVLKRVHFDKAAFALTKATNDLAKLDEQKPPYPWVFPIACPPLTAFQTLPEAYKWIDVIRGGAASFSDNLIPSGQFDDGGIAAMAKAGWTEVGRTSDGIQAKIEVEDGSGYGSEENAALRLLVAPTVLDQKVLDKMAPFLDHEVAAVRTPAIPVARDQLYRIRVLVRLNRELPSGTGGLIVRDSLGGRPYEFRVINACPKWREVTLYRLAPEDGTMTITLGLAGYGEAYFDRLRVDAIDKDGSTPATNRPAEPIARRPAPPNPNPAVGNAETRPRR